jgi:hypothetical protein
MASDTFIIFRGVADVLVNYKITGDICGQGPDVGELEWWFGPEDTIRFPEVTAEEEEAICDHIAKVASEDRYEPMEGDVSLSFAREPGEPLGTPLNELAGRPDGTLEGQRKYENFVRIAKSWGYD